MSKVYTLAVACLMLVSTAWGQLTGAQQTDDVAQQRERIEAARQQKTVELDTQAAACWSKFAVTDCLNKVKTQRRAMLADFRRQEIRLNDQERQQRAAQQMQRNREKAAEWAQRQTGNRSLTEANADSPDQRQERLNEKIVDHQQRAKAVPSVVPASKAPSGLDARTVVRNRDAYAEKLRATEQRRREREKRILEKASSSVPLPTTPP